MKIYKLFLSLAATILFCNYSFSQPTDNALTSKEKSDGWKLLFDGKTATGWHTYGRETAGKAWSVQDGAFYLDAKNLKTLGDSEGGDLVTNDEYENFDLKLDWKIGVKGNSGIIFYIHEDTTKYPATYMTGMEMQVLDNGTPTRRGHDDARLYTHRAGDLYDLLASKDVAHPQGEWNHVEIVSVNGRLDFYMNGEHTLSTTIWDDTWKKMIAISKFKDMPGFGTFKKGKISLQDHGEDVWFKNIKIKRL
ncbi:MAG: 3-keto-disaccharide hydrolase [Ginsengibacter sp.]